MLLHQPQSMLPTADRNQFAVEIFLPSGTSVEKTAMVADSLEQMIRKDPRVISVTSFKGCNSPKIPFFLCTANTWQQFCAIHCKHNRC